MKLVIVGLVAILVVIVICVVVYLNSGSSANTDSPIGAVDSGPIAPQTCQGITVYDDFYFTGDALKLPIGNYDQSKLYELGWNDRISSFKIPAKCRARFYVNGNKDGLYQEFVGPTEVSNPEAMPWSFGVADNAISGVFVYEA